VKVSSFPLASTTQSDIFVGLHWFECCSNITSFASDVKLQ